MDTVDKFKKLQTLPWYALYDIAVKVGIEEREISGKDKSIIIDKIILKGTLTNDELEQYVNDYIYGDRITFTLWTFQKVLDETNFQTIQLLENTEKDLIISGYRNLKIISVKDYEERLELLYVYSKEYTYVNEEGKNSGVWEQHRGCLWIGKKATYLACISKHEKMTKFIVKYLGKILDNLIVQIKPPKSAVDKCTNFKEISRIVLQGKGGEKTVVSRSGGITLEQKEEIERIRAERIDTSGSFISQITENMEATIKYNVTKGSIGIYKHLPATVLFEWSEHAIEIILEEIEKLKGKPAEEIFREVGQEIKWYGTSMVENNQLNWYLTQIIAALDKDEYENMIPSDKKEILENEKLFLKIPRVYCEVCDSFEIPFCLECGKELKIVNGVVKDCDCGAPGKIGCLEGHSCEIINWYIPKDNFFKMINNNVQKVFKDHTLDYSVCIAGDRIQIVNGMKEEQEEVEIPFARVECFKHDEVDIEQRVYAYAVNMNEKCGKGCSYENILKCIRDDKMVCLPKVFYTILPNFRPQPHKGMEYGDVNAEVRVGNKAYDLKGIIKKNSRNKKGRNTITDDEKIMAPLLSSAKEGEEIFRQFIEQGMVDNRCQIIAIIAPQYIDNGFKASLRYLAKLSGKKIIFIELDEICQLIYMNDTIGI